MFEVTYMTIESNFETDELEQVFTTEQFKTLDDAMKYYDGNKHRVDVEYIRLAVILVEDSN